MPIVHEQIRLDYRLTFEAPFHFGTGLRRGLIDRTVARDHDDYLIVPGTTLKGVVRERCEQLAAIFNLHVTEPHDTQDAETRIHEARRKDPDIITRIFGSRFEAGKLFFDDAQLATLTNSKSDEAEASGPNQQDADRSEESRKVAPIGREFFNEPEHDEAKEDYVPILGKYKLHQVETRTQVSLSRLTRTAKAGHLYTSEYGIRQLCFEGCIYGYIEGFRLDGVTQGTYSLLLLVAGLLSIDRIGGMKSTGAGQVQTEIRQLLIDDQVIECRALLHHFPDIELYPLEREENL